MPDWEFTIRQVAEMTGLQYFDVWYMYQQGWTLDEVFARHPIINQEEQS